MSKVWLVYEDDYGGMFSPYFLTAVYPEDKEKEAWEQVKKNWGGGNVVEAEDRGLDLKNYPSHIGGLFNED